MVIVNYLPEAHEGGVIEKICGFVFFIDAIF